VTIIAGFRCSDGIVVCADTQETISSISKRNVPKLRFEPSNHLPFSGDDLAVAFCGASDNGPFIDKVVDNAWKQAKLHSSLDEVCSAIEQSIKDTYEEYGRIYQPGYCPQAELIYGVKIHGHSKLFSALGPAVNEKDTYCSGGAGYYMADFLAGRMYSDGLDIHQCIILAAYILFQAKEHVDGCGGDSQIAVLREDASSGCLELERIGFINKNLDDADRNLSRLLLYSANLSFAKREYKKQVASVLDLLESARDNQLKDVKQWQQFMESFHKLYGFPPHRFDVYGLAKR